MLGQEPSGPIARMPIVKQEPMKTSDFSSFVSVEDLDEFSHRATRSHTFLVQRTIYFSRIMKKTMPSKTRLDVY